MNKLIYNQLNKCERCKLPVFDQTTTSIFIQKQEPKKDKVFEKDHCYLIKIADHIINPPEGYTLAKNWNGNTNPPNKFMNVSCIQIMGKMVKVDGIGYNPETNSTLSCVWSGWLPVSDIKILEEI